jgi:hypothetical protein
MRDAAVVFAAFGLCIASTGAQGESAANAIFSSAYLICGLAAAA